MTRDHRRSQITANRKSRPGKRSEQGYVLLAVMLILFMILAGMLLGLFQTKSSSSSGATGLTGATGNNILSQAARIKTYGAENLAEAGVRMAIEWINDLPSTSTVLKQNPIVIDNTTVSGFWQTNGGITPSTVGNYWKIGWDNSDNTGKNYILIRIYPYQTNDTDTLKKYIVEAAGVYNNTSVQVARASIRQVSFAKYAMAVDDMNGVSLVAGRIQFGGPVLINDKSNNGVKIVWDDVTTDPNDYQQIFTYPASNAVTIGTNNVTWLKLSDFTAGTPTDWSRVVANGNVPITNGTTNDLPTADNTQAQNSFGAGASAPTTFLNTIEPVAGAPVSLTTTETINGVSTSVPVGVSIPNTPSSATTGTATGGIVISGPVDSVVFATDPSKTTKQQIQIYQSGSAGGSNYRLRTIITVDRSVDSNGNDTSTTTAFTQWAKDDANNATNPWYSSSSAGTTYTYSGATSGVIYSMTDSIGQQNSGDGTNDIGGGVHGVIADNVLNADGTIAARNSWTIATNSSSSASVGRDVNIDGDLEYNTMATDGNGNVTGADATRSGMLGIVANDISVNQYYFDPTTSKNVRSGSTPVEIKNLAISATTFAYDTFSALNYASRSIGVLNIFGGYIASKAGQFGRYDPIGKVMISGLERSLNFDSRTQNSPPPAFPTSSTSYELTSYQRVDSTVDGKCSISAGCSVP